MQKRISKTQNNFTLRKNARQTQGLSITWFSDCEFIQRGKLTYWWNGMELSLGKSQHWLGEYREAAWGGGNVCQDAGVRSAGICIFKTSTTIVIRSENQGVWMTILKKNGLKFASTGFSCSWVQNEPLIFHHLTSTSFNFLCSFPVA